MSILIKGMEMPKSCDYCLARETVGLDKWKCRLSGAEFSSWDVAWGDKPQRHNKCPLIFVPEHGRLIDADALAHDLDCDVENDQWALDEMDFVGKERERVQFDKDCKQNCMWYLSEAPTIIPADKEEQT